jgi:hypothetical protein
MLQKKVLWGVLQNNFQQFKYFNQQLKLITGV